MSKVLIHIEGGVVQGVFCEDRDVEVIIRDADIDGEVNDVREDEGGYRYREYETVHYGWDALATKPFEGTPIFEIGTSVLVPSPIPGHNEAWAHEFEGTIKDFRYDIDTDTKLAVVEDMDGECFDVEVERLEHA